ncbi:hypothetical protein, partial [Segatella oulorum]|uniref:hypothetical protein n=1 Tax=Segatella oulorum TaxID=28136 RepID=UPI0028EC218D
MLAFWCENTKESGFETVTTEYPKKVNGCGLSRLNTPKSQRMRTFTAEYPKKVNGCELSRQNTPKKSTDADFHGRIPQKSQRMRT